MDENDIRHAFTATDENNDRCISLEAGFQLTGLNACEETLTDVLCAHVASLLCKNKDALAQYNQSRLHPTGDPWDSTRSQGDSQGEAERGQGPRDIGILRSPRVPSDSCVLKPLEWSQSAETTVTRCPKNGHDHQS